MSTRYTMLATKKRGEKKVEQTNENRANYAFNVRI